MSNTYARSAIFIPTTVLLGSPAFSTCHARREILEATALRIVLAQVLKTKASLMLTAFQQQIQDRFPAFASLPFADYKLQRAE